MSIVESIERDAEKINQQARKTALQAVGKVSIEPTSLVSYHSNGQLLIIGEPNRALAISTVLKEEGLRCYILAQGEGIDRAEGDVPMVSISQGVDVRVAGHLGEFAVSLILKEQGEIEVTRLLETGFSHFDLVLDLGAQPRLAWEMLPFGYYAPRGDEMELQRVLTELPVMLGDFEKARFFQYNPDICAHGNSGLKGCSRCLDTCPTGAISSLGDKIEVDPYYCQGAGSCATACPSGAIVYSFPTPADTLKRLRVLLHTYREAGGAEPVLLFHDAEAGKVRLSNLAEVLPSQVIPIELEEIGSLGMDVWLAALTYGASQVLILANPQTPPSVLRELQAQLAIAHVLLEGMNYPPTALRLLNTTDDAALLASLSDGEPMPSIEPAGFAGSNAKRDTLYYAIDYLAVQGAPLSQNRLAMPDHAPFGEIQVNRATCTLCMACVSVCPASALFDGADTPRLEFLEAKCVQCGLCEKACPEHAIDLQPRFLFDPQQRRRRRVLNEEAAFNCIACGKPFATRSIIEKMMTKLEGHRMFQDKQALRRLQMCGDCRVRDIFSDELGN